MPWTNAKHGDDRIVSAARTKNAEKITMLVLRERNRREEFVRRTCSRLARRICFTHLALGRNC